ncbi:MAG: YciI family protein [Actinomycetota bacterium]
MPKFMMIIKGDQPPGELPSEEMLAAMGRYNEELTQAGVLLDLAGLHPTAEGARVQFSGGGRTVVEGPFTEPWEQVAGYWIIQTTSMAEAIEWAKRVPFETGGAHGYDREGGPEGEIEIRQLFELDEFDEGPAVDRARELEKELAQK